MYQPQINPFDSSTAVDPAGKVCFRSNLTDLIRSRYTVVFRIGAVLAPYMAPDPLMRKAVRLASSNGRRNFPPAKQYQ